MWNKICDNSEFLIYSTEISKENDTNIKQYACVLSIKGNETFYISSPYTYRYEIDEHRMEKKKSEAEEDDVEERKDVEKVRRSVLLVSSNWPY